MERNGTGIELEKVTYLMHESDMARDDLKNKRLWMTVNGLIAALIAIMAIIAIKRR